MNEPNIRFAVLGTAKIARTVGPKIQTAKGAELTGVASRSADKAAAFAAEFGIPESYGSYQAALDDPEIDAVYIPLPPSMHLEWTTKAAKAGKHVFCEKPLATNATEAEQMIAGCRQHNVVLLDGVMWYHTPRATAIKHYVDSGQLGELRQLTSVFTFRWDTFPLENVRLQRELGGGSLLDLGWYCVGAAIWLFNDIPRQVFARAIYHNDVDARMNGFLWFNDGRVATIECGFDTVKRRWMEVAGAKQNLVCDDFTRPWNRDKPRFWTHDDDGSATEHVINQKPQEECLVEAFCELIRTGSTTHPWLDLSIKTQLVCDALDQSARARTVVGIPPRLESQPAFLIPLSLNGGILNFSAVEQLGTGDTGIFASLWWNFRTVLTIPVSQMVGNAGSARYPVIPSGANAQPARLPHGIPSTDPFASCHFRWILGGFGEVTEWPIVQHWKCCVRATGPGVRIPPSPLDLVCVPT